MTSIPPSFPSSDPSSGPLPGQAKRTTRVWIGLLVGAIVLSSCVIGGTAAVVLTSRSNKAAPSAPGSTAATPPAASVSVEPSPSGPDSHSDACSYEGTGGPAKQVTLPSPDPTLEGRTALATLVTSQGTITISLDGQKAPCTVRSFESLARQNYFDGTSCHRLTTTGIFVLQCGDPTGTGSGGPGYQFGNENLPTAAAPNYPAGTVAMANAGAGTNGSQFFLVYADTTLPADYTVFGTVSSGMDVLKRVAAGGSDNSIGAGDGKPHIPVQLTKVTVGPA